MIMRLWRTLMLAGVLAVTCVCVGCDRTPRAAAAPSTCDTAVVKTLRVGAWNIQWLGSPEKRGRDPKSQVPQDAADLADYIAASGVDVLGMEEITDDADEERRPGNKTLDKTFKLLSNMTGQPWKYRLFPKPDGDRYQLCGVAWNTAKVSPVGEPFALPVKRLAGPLGESEPLWKRSPFAMKFSAGKGLTDFVVVVLHMKSNRGTQEMPDGPSTHRKLEAEELTRVLPEAMKLFRGEIDDERDFIIIGDTNCLKASEPSLKVLTSAGFIDLNAADVPSWFDPSNRIDKYPPAPFDRIFVPAKQPEFSASKQTVYYEEYLKKRMIDAITFNALLSDHALVWTEISIQADDD